MDIFLALLFYVASGLVPIEIIRRGAPDHKTQTFVHRLKYHFVGVVLGPWALLALLVYYFDE